MDSEKRKFDHFADGEQDPTPKKRVVGPSMPPTVSPAPEMPEVEDSETDDSDDDFGPGLPPSLGGPVAPVDIPDTTVHEAQTHSTGPPAKESGRDEWMLKPPEQGDWASKIDPTQLRARKFQTGKSARSGGASKELDAAWTETPEERMRRLGDEVMGVGKPSTNLAKQPPKSGPNKNQSTEEKVKKYNVSRRDLAITGCSRDPNINAQLGTTREKSPSGES